MGEHEADFFFRLGSAAAHVCRHGFPKDCQARRGIVKTGDGLIQAVRRVVGQTTLELPEGHRALSEIVCALSLIVAGRVGDKAVCAPVLSVFVPVEGLSVF